MDRKITLNVMLLGEMQLLCVTLIICTLIASCSYERVNTPKQSTTQPTK